MQFQQQRNDLQSDTTARFTESLCPLRLNIGRRRARQFAKNIPAPCRWLSGTYDSASRKKHLAGSERDPAVGLFGVRPNRQSSEGLHAPKRGDGRCLFLFKRAEICFRTDADVLTDTCSDVNSLARKPDSSLSERLLNTDSPTRQRDLIFSFLPTQVNHNTNQQDSVTEYALTRLIQSKGNIPVNELWQNLNVSERTLEQKFRQSVGVSPKLFARICRFQASITQLRANKYDKLSDITFENSYADQSHFIRAFSEFSEFSPAQYQKKSREVVKNFPELIG